MKSLLTATVLLGYLLVSKLECFDEGSQSVAGYQLFHHCMNLILKPLIKAGRKGLPMICADSKIQWVVLIITIYITDYPEQCLVACCKENQCPQCQVSPDQHGELQPLWRDQAETIKLLEQQKRQTEKMRNPTERFEELGLCAVYNPFWAELPHTDIFSCFTPDILHQLHKGIFKDHLVSWCRSMISAEELDYQFKAVPSYLRL